MRATGDRFNLPLAYASCEVMVLATPSLRWGLYAIAVYDGFKNMVTLSNLLTLRYNLNRAIPERITV